MCFSVLLFFFLLDTYIHRFFCFILFLCNSQIFFEEKLVSAVPRGAKMWNSCVFFCYTNWFNY
jgi:hypothetical protein